MNTRDSIDDVVSFLILNRKYGKNLSRRKITMIENQGEECFVQKFLNNFPHIVENIFFYLVYYTYNKCKKVNSQWKDLLTSEIYNIKARSLFMWEIFKDELNLFVAVWKGNIGKAKTLLASGMLNNINTKSTGII